MLQKTEGALSKRKHQSGMEKSRHSLHKIQNKDKQNKNSSFILTYIYCT